MLDWILSHKLELYALTTSVIVGASVALRAVAKFTKTPKDDVWADRLDTLVGWLKKLSLHTDPAKLSR